MVADPIPRGCRSTPGIAPRPRPFSTMTHIPAAPSAPPARLPRLLYIGDQPVEQTVGGPALLYRLLEDYPVASLRIVESNLAVSRPDRRLPGVAYDAVPVGVPRLQFTRFRPQHCSLMYLTGAARRPLYSRAVRAFDPEAILTISHGTSWLTAAAVARQRRIPLHLVLHDDIVRMSGVSPWLHTRVEESLGRVYRQAASRMCIGPVMEAHYRRRYGVPGSIVFPSRSATTASLPPPPASGRTSLVFAYAGSVHQGGYNGDLPAVAAALEPLGHRLLVYSPACAGGRAPPGLDRPNVIPRPAVPSGELLGRLRAEADALVLPMSFDESMRIEMELCFPSKLADYTATGLPILLWAPPTASAVQWAREREGALEVVDSADPAALRGAASRLADPAVRESLGRTAAAAGDASFSHAAVIGQFRAALLATTPAPARR